MKMHTINSGGGGDDALIFHNSVPPGDRLSPVNIQNNEAKLISVQNIINRPSSPRHFFEKLYGHLETTTVSDDSIHKNQDKFLSTSPDVDNLLFECTADQKFMLALNSIQQKNNQTNQLSGSITITPFTSLPFLTPGMCNLPPIIGITNEPQLPSGLSAFLARRRRKEGRPRRQRTTFSSEQTLRLEVEFHRNEYITRGKRFELAENLKLSETQIKIWFQNRRAKDKRIEKAQIDQHYRWNLTTNGMMVNALTYPQFHGGLNQQTFMLDGFKMKTQQQSCHQLNELNIFENSTNYLKTANVSL